MHQWTCGVDDTLWIDGYQVQVIDVTDEVVKLGVALPMGERGLHEIRLPSASSPAPSAGEPSSSSPSAVDEARSV
jgi:hypothetical protein